MEAAQAKTCSTCKVEKPFSAFAKHETHRDGIYNVCKACQAERRRRRAQELQEEPDNNHPDSEARQTCKKCGAEKPLSRFRKDPLCKDGVVKTCLDCAHLRQKAAQQQRKERCALPESKRCSKCRVEKPSERFFENYSCADGLEGQCKDCKRRLRDQRITAIAKAVKPKCKRCKSCQTEKPLAEFYAHPSGEFGVEALCRDCKRNYRKGFERKPLTKEQQKRQSLKQNYNLTPERYLALIELQDYSCKVCRTSLSATHQVCVDHDHVSGAVRGILCNSCNSAIGLLREDVTLMRSLIRYLEHYQVEGVERR